MNWAAVPELARLLPSPPYAAWMVTVPAVRPVTVTEQVPDDKAHVVPEGKETLPTPENFDIVMVPVGDWPVVVATQELPEHVTVVTVAALLTVIVVLPELP